jgi:hypothetical protein
MAPIFASGAVWCPLTEKGEQPQLPRLRIAFYSGNGASSLPDLNVVAIHQLFGVLDCRLVGLENDRLWRRGEAAILEKVNSVFRHGCVTPSASDLGCPCQWCARARSTDRALVAPPIRLRLAAS